MITVEIRINKTQYLVNHVTTGMASEEESHITDIQSLIKEVSLLCISFVCHNLVNRFFREVWLCVFLRIRRLLSLPVSRVMHLSDSIYPSGPILAECAAPLLVFLPTAQPIRACVSQQVLIASEQSAKFFVGRDEYLSHDS